MGNSSPAPVIEARQFSFRFGNNTVLKEISMEIFSDGITGIFGAPGSGKSTLLRCFNRLNETFGDGVSHSGELLVLGQDIHAPSVNQNELRRVVPMVLSDPQPLPFSIARNVLHGVSLRRPARQFPAEERDQIVESALRKVGLWEALKDQLESPAVHLPRSHQQMLCLARIVAMEPRIILLDDPCQRLDPVAAQRLEELLYQLQRDYTLIVATQQLDLIRRLTQVGHFLWRGELIESGDTPDLLSNPQQPKTQSFLEGRFD